MPRVTIALAGQASAGQVTQVAVTNAASRIITGLRNGSGNLELIVWAVGSYGAFQRQGDALGGDISRIAVAGWPEGPGVVTAVRTASGALKVIAWKVTSEGSILRVGEDEAGIVSEVSIASPTGFSGVVTPVCTASGELKVIAWKVSSTGTVTRADDATRGSCSEIAAKSLSSAKGAARVATALRNAAGSLEIIIWAITPNGVVTRLGDAAAGPITDVALTYKSSPNADLISASRGTSGDLTVIGWSVDNNASLKRVNTGHGGGGGAIDATTWTPDVHTYVITALKTESGHLKLIVWRSGQDLRRHGEISGEEVQTVAVTGWSKGAVTASRDASGNLRLQSWALRPNGIRLLHRVWPVAVVANAGQVAVDDAVMPWHTAGKYGDLSAEGIQVTSNGDARNDIGDLASPPWQKRFYPVISGHWDPMLAVGHQYVIVTYDHAIAFFDRNGNPLPSRAGEPTNMSATSFFQAFIAEKNPDGSPNPDNINLISPHKINEFYDTRVFYDSTSRRFAIVSAARKTSTADTRYYAFAVSKTEDPRDGFEQYMTTESNYRDFPRMVIHGDRLLVGHNAAGQETEGETPVLSAFHYPSLRQGLLDPPNWQYYPTNLNGAPRVFLVGHHGNTSGVSFLFDIRKGDPVMRLIAFPIAGEAALAPMPVFAEAPLTTPAPWPGPFGVFRNNAIHIAGHIMVTPRVPNVAPPRNSIRLVKIPLSKITTGEITCDSGSIVDRVFGLNAPSDAPADKVTYEFPGIAVNRYGDCLYGYGRTGIETQQPLFPEARYTVWIQGESKQRRSALLQAGSYQPTSVYDDETEPTPVTHVYYLDYATAVVDPVDDQTFWFIHEYADNATKGWKTVVGIVDPRA